MLEEFGVFMNSRLLEDTFTWRDIDLDGDGFKDFLEVKVTLDANKTVLFLDVYAKYGDGEGGFSYETETRKTNVLYNFSDVKLEYDGYGEYDIALIGEKGEYKRLLQMNRDFR